MAYEDKSKAVANDAQAQDIREGDTPVVEEGIEGAAGTMKMSASGSAKGAKEEKSGKAEPSGDSGLKAKIAKAAGVKTSDVLGFNAERQTIVTNAGGKYTLDADGKTIIHIAGPVPPSLVKDE